MQLSVAIFGLQIAAILLATSASLTPAFDERQKIFENISSSWREISRPFITTCSVTVQRLKKLTLFNIVKAIIDSMSIGIGLMMLYYSYNPFLSSLLLSRFLPKITFTLQNLFVRNSTVGDGGRKKKKIKKYETNVKGKKPQRFYFSLQQITFHIITCAAIITSIATYNDIKASPAENAAAIVVFFLILIGIVFNVLHVRSHAILYLLKKITKDNAVAVKLNLKSQERKFSQENGTVNRWNVNNGSVRSTKNGCRFAAAAGHWNYYFIGFLLLATPHFANASFTPADETALKTAVTACLSETGDGSCPIFAASNDNTGNPYGVIGTWDVSSVTDMSYST